MPKNMNTAVNTTDSTARDTDSKAARASMETLEQGIEIIRSVFRQSRRMDIRIAAIDGADRLGNIIEGGVNGYMFALQRGVDIPDVPEPILEVLRNAGIAYSSQSAWKEAAERT
jgi:hypothetical protein